MMLPQDRSAPEKPYRHGIVAVIIDTATGKVLVGKIHADRRKNVRHAWSPVEGGINEGETPEAAARREVHEEVGLTAPLFLAESTGKILYDFDDAHLRYAGKSLTVVFYTVDASRFTPNLNPEIDHEGPSFAEVRWIEAKDVGALLKDGASTSRAAFCEKLAAQILEMTTAIQVHGVENVLQSLATGGRSAAVATKTPHRPTVTTNQEGRPAAMP